MTRGSAFKTSMSLCFLSLLLLCDFGAQRVVAAPQPVPPGMMYHEDYGMDHGQSLVDRLKKIVERKEENIEKEIAELAEEKMDIEALVEKARNQREHQLEQQQEFSIEDTESLPVPAAIYHNEPLHYGKRNSYIALCHFKICNMGRKRQVQ